MNDTQSLAFIRAYFHALFVARNVDALDTFLHEDYVDDDIGDPAIDHRADSKAFLKDWFRREPTIRVEVQRVICHDEVISAYLSWVCTRENTPFVLQKGVALFRIKDGKIQKRHTFLYQETEIIPARENAPGGF